MIALIALQGVSMRTFLISVMAAAAMAASHAQTAPQTVLNAPAVATPTVTATTTNTPTTLNAGILNPWLNIVPSIGPKPPRVDPILIPVRR
jgi:ABC-type transport system substrate-binding protein